MRKPPLTRDLSRMATIVTSTTLIAVAVAILRAHVEFLRHVGGLWRDEANTVAFAGMPSLAAIWSALRYDSVPLASTLLVRAWMGLGLGSDIGLRALGFIVGGAVVMALGANAWLQRARIPSCSVLLFALNVWVIRVGDALRPTGLAMLFIILTFAFLGAYLERPRPAWAVAAATCAILSVHSIYSNAPLVGAIALAGVATGVLRRSPSRTFTSAGIGLVAALSLLPYLPAVRAARDWALLVQAQPSFSRLWIALDSAAWWDRILWVGLVVAGVAVAVMRLAAVGKTPADEAERARALYAGATLVVGGLAFVAFIWWTQLATQAWYYLPLMALCAASLDVLAGPLIRKPTPRIALCVVIVLISAAHVIAAMPLLRLRQTNLDLVAAQLRARAKPEDLVLVSPWFFGVPLQRYYTGPAPWITIPPLADVSIHRYDLLKQCMQDPTCVDSVGQRIAHTLASGGRIWLVGYLPPLAKGEVPPPPPRAPAPDFGWSADAYGNVWAKRVLASFVARLASAEKVDVPAADPVNATENVPLALLTGVR